MPKNVSYGRLMARISENYLSTVISFIRPHGIDRYYNPILHICEHSGKITQKDLSEAMSRDKVFVMRLVDYLCDRGLVERKKDTHDRRCQLLVATEKARKLKPFIEDAIAKTNDIFFSNFTKQEISVFTKGIDKLIDVIAGLPESDFIIYAEPKNKVLK